MAQVRRIAGTGQTYGAGTQQFYTIYDQLGQGSVPTYHATHSAKMLSYISTTVVCQGTAACHHSSTGNGSGNGSVNLTIDLNGVPWLDANGTGDLILLWITLANPANPITSFNNGVGEWVQWSEAIGDRQADYLFSHTALASETSYIFDWASTNTYLYTISRFRDTTPASVCTAKNRIVDGGTLEDHLAPSGLASPANGFAVSWFSVDGPPGTAGYGVVNSTTDNGTRIVSVPVEGAETTTTWSDFLRESKMPTQDSVESAQMSKLDQPRLRS